MIKRRLDNILDNIRKGSGKPLILLLVMGILTTSFLIGCEGEKEETLTDELYSYKTKYIGDNSKVSGIISKLEFQEDYTYESMEILSKEEPYGLNLYFAEDINEISKYDFNYESAILFSLVDNLDYINYVVRIKDEKLNITREEIDNMTTSILTRRTNDIGSSKNKFEELVKIYEEIKLKKKDNTKNDFAEEDINNVERERKVLDSILSNFVPDGIFKIEEVIPSRDKLNKNSFLYLRNVEDDETVTIKIESIFDKNSDLIQYHFKNYFYDFKDNQINSLSQEEALMLANKFVNKYIDEDVELLKIPDLYSSLYEEDKHESYGDLENRFIVIVDLENGFIEFFYKRIN